MSVFSDLRIIRRLQTEFIPVVGDTHFLQNRPSEAQRWFMKAAARVNARILDGTTAQGFYVMGADGASYGFRNHHDPEVVNAFLSQNLTKFQQEPPRPVAVTSREVEAGLPPLPDPSTSALRVFSRIRPLPPGANELNYGVGRDHFWIYADEIRQILTASSSGNEAFALPRALVARLVRFHLVDNVRGEPDMWRPDEVRQAVFTAKRVRATATAQTFTFFGAFVMRTDNGGRGLQGAMRGEFTLDPKAAKITRFRAYGEGQAWGAGTYTGGAPKGRFPFLIAIVETQDALGREVPPQAVACGHDYRAPELRLP